jgi:hypothetical protein
MFVSLLIVAIVRLRVRVGAAIIGSLLTLAATAGMIVAGLWLIQFLWNTMMDKGSISLIPPPTSVHP